MADGQGDDFDAAFAKIAQEDGDAAAALAPQGESNQNEGGDEASKDAAAAAASADGTADDGGESQGADDAADGDAQSEEPPKPEAKAAAQAVDPADAELLRNFASVLRGASEAPKQQAQQQQAPQPEALPEIYSAEEKTFLDEYEKDWPDIARAEQLRRKSEYRELVGFVFQTMGKHLTALNEQVRDLTTRAHYGDLTAVVGPEYDDLVDKVTTWVDTQPAYLQAAYKNVVDNGTPDEVKDLIDRYKRETGYQAPNANPAPAPEQKKTVLSSAAKQAAASLAPVASKRGAVSSSFDDLDFSSAFDQFATKM